MNGIRHLRKNKNCLRMNYLKLETSISGAFICVEN